MAKLSTRINRGIKVVGLVIVVLSLMTIIAGAGVVVSAKPECLIPDTKLRDAVITHRHLSDSSKDTLEQQQPIEDPIDVCRSDLNRRSIGTALVIFGVIGTILGSILLLFKQIRDYGPLAGTIAALSAAAAAAAAASAANSAANAVRSQGEQLAATATLDQQQPPTSVIGIVGSLGRTTVDAYQSAKRESGEWVKGVTG